MCPLLSSHSQPVAQEVGDQLEGGNVFQPLVKSWSLVAAAAALGALLAPSSTLLVVDPD